MMNRCFLKKIKRCLLVLSVVCLLLTVTGCAGGEKPYAVSGAIVEGNGDGIDGVSIVVTGGKNVQTTTGDGGKYALVDLTGACTLTPVLEGYSFEPKNKAVTGESASVNFTGTRSEPKISTLIVVNGSGSGEYAEGTTVFISANVPEAGKAFDQWTADGGGSGDGGSFANLNAETTNFVMPGNDVTVTATYRDPIAADYFEFNSQTGTITGFYKNGKHNNLGVNLAPEIPAAINGVAVKIIGAEVFKGVQITSVVIPEGVITIEKWAFNNNLLTSVVLPDTLKTISEYAFTANRLEHIVIPNGIKAIGAGAFWLNELTVVTLPNGLEHIGGTAFEDNLIAEITFPDSLISIGDYAFSSNKFTEVIIPSGVNSIGGGAFNNNLELTSLQIPDNVVIGGSQTFYQGGYYRIWLITIGANVTLGNYLLGEDNDFRTVYDIEGAGVYKKIDGVWEKQ